MQQIIIIIYGSQELGYMNKSWLEANKFWAQHLILSSPQTIGLADYNHAKNGTWKLSIWEIEV